MTGIRMLSLLAATVSMIAVAGESPAIERLVPIGGQRGTTVEVSIVGKPGDGNLSVVSGSDDVAAVVGESKTSAKITIAPTARPGIYWLRFCNPFGATELKPFVVGLVPELAEVEPNAKIAESQIVALPSTTINGVLEKAGDVDTFAVTLTKGQILVASLQAHAILGSPMDGVLQIINDKGNVLVQNDDDLGFDPRLQFVAPNDGKWFVRTFAFPAAPNSTIGFAGGADYNYRLTLTTEAVVEHTMPAVRFSGDAETTLALHGWNIAEPTVVLPSDQEMLVTGLAMPFRVSSVDIPVTKESLLSNERTLTVPIAVSGEISSSGEDAFTINAVMSQKLSFSVKARAIGSLLDPVLAVFGSDGKLIQESDDINGDNPDSELHLTMPADGPYRVTVRDRYQNSGNRFFYVLRCEESRPTFSATVATTAVTMPSDKPMEIPITVDRRHGFAEAVDFRFEGLPDGITAECPRSEKDGESSKAITLKVSGATKEAFQGPVKVVAESVDTKQRQSISFRTTDGITVDQVWLTVPATATVEPAAPAAEM